jgi:uncharacterized RDD family membrane protein YckC
MISMQNTRLTTLLIRTPEGIVFSLPLACPVTRCLAWVVDFACIAALMAIVRLFISLAAIISADVTTALGVVVFFVVQVGYAIGCEWLWRGQTLGKRLLRLRVMDVQGLQLQFSQVVLRNLLRFVDMLPAFYLVGGVACLLNDRAQRLGDLVANTIVVRSPKLEQPDLDLLLAGKYNSLRDYPHLQVRLRQRVSPRQAALALQALLRRDQLDGPARLELFEQLASLFQSLVPFPPEAVEGITAEQYVRNVVDTLFRPHTGQNSSSRAGRLATPSTADTSA